MRTADSLGAGTPLRRLVALLPGAIGALGEEGVYALSPRCGRSFRLTSPGPIASFRSGTPAALRALPGSTVVTRVLIFECIESSQQ